MNTKSLFICLFSIILTGTLFSSPSKYKLNEKHLDEMMAGCEETKLIQPNEIFNVTITKSKDGDAQTRSGYLVRAFFCGFIASHRTYMGTNGESMWWFYCCVPVAGHIDYLVDFWWVVFDDKALEKYRNNGKFFVWMDSM